MANAKVSMRNAADEQNNHLIKIELWKPLLKVVELLQMHTPLIWGGSQGERIFAIYNILEWAIMLDTNKQEETKHKTNKRTNKQGAVRTEWIQPFS
jgi:hypothetical protein